MNFKKTQHFSSVVENNPSRFGIVEGELHDRKNFIVRIRNSLADMKLELEGK